MLLSCDIVSLDWRGPKEGPAIIRYVQPYRQPPGRDGEIAEPLCVLEQRTASEYF